MMRLVKSISDPTVWVLVSMILGLIWTRRLRRRRRVRVGWYFMLIAAVIFAMLTNMMVSQWLCYGIERRYPPAGDEELARLDAMVILSAGARPQDELRQRPQLNGFSYARVAGGVYAFKHSGADVLVMSGGLMAGSEMSVAEVMRDFAVEMGMPAEKIEIQGVSRTTAEDAIMTAEVLGPGSGRHVGVATSALHMRRAVGIFRKVLPDEVIVAVPTDYLTCPPRSWDEAIRPSATAFVYSTAAIHEYIGLIWYKLRYGS